jgi:hypothetical protein
MKHTIFAILILMCFSFSKKEEFCALHSHTPIHFSNKEYPQNYFRSPVRHTIKLAGTFGELRPNHFHAGIDIKSSKGSVGDDLLAAADGYVARIKVRAGGYGNALYIKHPNGYTTVYAHMHTFTDELNDFVKKNQYSRKSYGVDLYPSAGQFKFKKGERIGVLGNSGSSQGPHLHFEIRDSSNDRPLNPLLFGFEMLDNVPPKMHQIKIYHLNDKRETLDSKVMDLTKKSTGYVVSGDTISIGAWRVGFALKVYDHHNGVKNWNGIYSLEMLVDDQPFFDFKMEELSFSQTRYINAHMDYMEREKNKAYFNRCYDLPGNRLSIYGNQVDKGILKLYEKKTQKVTMLAKDASGNASKLEFWVKRKEVATTRNAPSFNYTFPYNQENSLNRDNLSLYFPKGSFYENLYFKYEIQGTDNTYYAPFHCLHNFETPVHKYFTIGIKPSAPIPAALKNKAYIAYLNKKGNIENCGGKWKNGKLTTQVRQLGEYSIRVDKTAPLITPISFSNNMKGYNKMVFKIKDDLPTGGKASGVKVKATVDGQWILLVHDGKKDKYIHEFDGRIQPGEHTLKIVATDNRGNTEVLERTFVR